jgi:hypothetical protein
MIPKQFEDWINYAKPFLGYMHEWLRAVKFLLDSDLDYVEIVSGTEGSGKSVFALLKMVWLLENARAGEIELNEHQLELWEDENYEKLAKEYIFLSAKDFLKAVNGSEKHYERAVIILDEAGRELFARESMQKVNRLLVKFFITARFLNNIYFLCVPNPKYLDIYLREERSHLISWIVLGIDYESYHPRTKRRLISIPRLVYQYFNDKYGWRWLTLNILRFDPDGELAHELASWKKSVPYAGIYELPPNIPTKLWAFYNGLWEAYHRLKKDTGFREFLDEVTEKLGEE